MHFACLGVFIDIIHYLLEYQKEITPLLHIELAVSKLFIKLEYIFNPRCIKYFGSVTPHPCYHLIQTIFIGIDAPYNIIKILGCMLYFFSDPVKKWFSINLL